MYTKMLLKFVKFKGSKIINKILYYITNKKFRHYMYRFIMYNDINKISSHISKIIFRHIIYIVFIP